MSLSLFNQRLVASLSIAVVLFGLCVPYIVFADAYSDALASYIANINREREALGNPVLTPDSSNPAIRVQYQRLEAGFRATWNEGPGAVELAQENTAFNAANPRVPPSNSTTCSGWNYLWNVGTCLMRTIMVGLGTLMVTAGAWILAVSGLFFDWLVDHTIVLFSRSIYDLIKDGVELAWTAFRDLANILIIGIFVFIAISIILGNKEWGQKRYVANVLIIAVLINFSLLFTKLIIDASNFTATQFYTASTGRTAQQALENDRRPTNVSGSTGLDPRRYATQGIAASFINFMGITTIGDTYDQLQKVAQNPQGGAFTAFLHGLFGATLLIAAAAVLLYGSFLLISRAILLIFLILTSSLAFATYLIPKGSITSYWTQWWSSLIRSAILAPILLMFLWATLKVAQAVGGTGGTLGGLTQNPEQGTSLNALFVYLIVLGLLYASFKVASSFSKQVGGLNWAAIGPALAMAAGGRFTGALARTTAGRAGSRLGAMMEAQAKNLYNPSEDGKEKSRLSKFMGRSMLFGSKPFTNLGKKEMNVMGTRLGAEIARTSGLKQDRLTGKNRGGFEGREKERAAAFEKEAKALSLSDEDRRKRDKANADKMREEARAAVLKERPDLEAEKKKADTDAGRARQEMKEALAEQRRNFEDLGKTINEKQQQLIEVTKEAAANPADLAKEAQAQALRDDIEHDKSRQKSLLRESDEKIKTARENLKKAVKSGEEVTKNIDDAAVMTGKLAGATIDKYGNVVREGKGGDVKLAIKPTPGAAEIGPELAHRRFTNTLMRATGLSTPENDKLAQAVKKKIGEGKKDQNYKKLVETMLKETKKDEGTAPASSGGAGGH